MPRTAHLHRRALSKEAIGGAAALTGALLIGACEPREATPPSPAAEADSAWFTKYGLPGPWSRDGATRAAFEDETDTCLRLSNGARADAPQGEGNDAAYRAFLDCMADKGWTRGAGPEPPDREETAAAASS